MKIYKIVITIYRIILMASIVLTGMAGVIGKDVIALPLAVFTLVIIVVYLLASFLCRFFDGEWVCDLAGTHFPAWKWEDDGCNLHSKCKKCGEDIMQDSQGGWF